MAGIKEKLEAVFGVSGADKFKREFEQADKTVAKSSKGMTGALKAVGAAAVAYLSVQTVKSIGQTVVSLTTLGDSFRVVQASSERLAKSIGQNSQEILRAVRHGVGGAVSDMEIFKQVNQAILLGIPVSAREMGNMATVATRLGRAVGRDAASALGDLVTGIGRMSPLILDNLGITIKAEEAFRGLGEGATDAEKRLAFFNAVMGKAGELSKTLGEQAAPLGERFDQMTARLSNLGVKVGDVLAGPVGRLLDLIDKVPTHTAVALARLNIMIANANPINMITNGLAPGHRKRIMEAYVREGVFDVNPSFRFGNNNGKINGSISERADMSGIVGLDEWDRRFAETMDKTEPQIRRFGDTFEAELKMVAKRGGEELEEIPINFGREFAKSFANINLGFQAMGINGNNLFVGATNLGAGISGLNSSRTAPGWVANKLLPALETFGFAGQAFAGAVGVFKGVSSFIGNIGKVNVSGLENFNNNADIDAGIADLESKRGLASDFLIDEGIAQLNARREELSASSAGSNAYSVATSITESQANSILAVLETQRAQDSERNSILGASLAVQTDMKFLMSVNSGNLMTFAG